MCGCASPPRFLGRMKGTETRFQRYSFIYAPPPVRAVSSGASPRLLLGTHGPPAAYRSSIFPKLHAHKFSPLQIVDTSLSIGRATAYISGMYGLSVDTRQPRDPSDPGRGPWKGICCASNHHLSWLRPYRLKQARCSRLIAGGRSALFPITRYKGHVHC